MLVLLVAGTFFMEKPRHHRNRPRFARHGGHPDAFRRLKQIAERKGYVILSARAAYLGDDGLTLLRRIAAVQRNAASHLQPSDRCLLAALQRCAVVLEEEGLRLRPLTLYKHWLVEGWLVCLNPTLDNGIWSSAGKQRTTEMGASLPPLPCAPNPKPPTKRPSTRPSALPDSCRLIHQICKRSSACLAANNG